MSKFEQQPPAPVQQPEGHGLLIINLLVQIAFGLMAMTICLPSMQQWGEIFSVGQPAVQLTFSAYVLAYGGLQLMYGPLSDRFGRRPVLLTGLGCALIGAMMAIMASDIVMLTFARFVQGAGSAAGMVIGRAMVQDMFTGSERTRVMAVIGMALGITPPLATVVGGEIHEQFGWAANFVLMAACALLLLIAAWRGLPSVRAPSAQKQHWMTQMLSAYGTLLRQPIFLMYVLLLGCTTATFYVFLSGAPIVLKSYGVGPAGIGWYIMCCPLFYIIGNFITSRHVHAWGERRILTIGQGLTVAGVVLMWALSVLGWDTALAFALPTMLVGMGHGFLVPPALTGTVGLNPALAGAAAGVAGLSQQFIGAFGGFSVGLVQHQGAMNVSLLMMLFTAVGVLMFALILFKGQAADA
ncbi:MAG: multidrug effflux MFS transporter [Burkholderiaceae bacterium]|nr:multidrug effflux MFS transporter [Burkholderiaceae bacterium]